MGDSAYLRKMACPSLPSNAELLHCSRPANRRGFEIDAVTRLMARCWRYGICPCLKSRASQQITIRIKGLGGVHSAVIFRLDANHGSLSNAYNAMGRPVYPTREQIRGPRLSSLSLQRNSSMPGN